MESESDEGQRVTFEPKSQVPAKVRFAIDVEVRAEPTAEPTKLNQCAPIKMVSGSAWSPGIYQALRLLGKTLEVVWERGFIHSLTFNLYSSITKLHSGTSC